MTAVQSIFIPRVSVFVTEYNIREEFLSIGSVRRVDFTPVNKRPGFVENVDAVVKSAFVHFNRLYECSVMRAINTYGSYKFYPSSLNRASEGTYWILLRNRNPIQDTMMNNAQIVESCRLLEKQVQEQAETIRKLEEKMEGVYHVTYQLVGGLFNQKTQTDAIDLILNALCPGTSKEKEITDDINMWPTTRQGDMHELRIEALEKELFDLVDVVNDHAAKGTMLSNAIHQKNVFVSDCDDETQDGALQTKKHQNAMTKCSDTNSTHSSMPDLIDDNSITSDSDASIPELESVSSNGSSRRLRNSYELCGNQ